MGRIFMYLFDRALGGENNEIQIRKIVLASTTVDMASSANPKVTNA